MVGVLYNLCGRFGRKNWVMAGLGWAALLVIGLGVAGCGDDATATPDLVALCRTPVVGAATPVHQGEIRPPVPDYPNAQNVEVVTPGPYVHSLEPNTPTSWSGVRYTRKITSFSTSDNAQVVLSYYRRELTKVGWEESNATPSAN